MIRLKFLLLALAALALWAAHVALLTPALSQRAAEGAGARATRGAEWVALKLAGHREAVATAALRLGARADLASAVSHRKSSAPTPEGLAQARSLVIELLPEARASAVVGLVAEAGQLWSLGEGSPRNALDGVDAATLAHAPGVTVEVLGGQAVAFASVPLVPGEAGKGAWLVLGSPLPLGTWLTEGIELAGLAALGVRAGEKVLASAGPKKSFVERAPTLLGAHGSGVVERGPASSLGPLPLPALAGEGGAPRLVAARAPLSATLEAISVASAEPVTGALADYQRFALYASLGFVGLALLAALTSRGRSQEEEDSPGVSVPASLRGQRSAGGPGPVPGPSFPGRTSSVGALPVTESAPAPEASPEDFHFGHTRAMPIPKLDLEDEPAGPLPPPVPFDAPQLQNGRGRTDPDHVPTASYPVHQPLRDPFAQAGDEVGGAAIGSQDDNPEATRVTAIPDELLRASARPHHSGSYPPVRGNTGAWQVQPAIALAPPVDEETQHFQETFDAFVATRERLGESGEALTFDRFSQKLRKNKEQLIQKYGCRTVRFQVYVKDGKTALKATPVKD